MRFNPKESVIHLASGTASKIKDGEKVVVNTIPFTDPNCGCGINCCPGWLVLPNFNSVHGGTDGSIVMYFKDGEAVFAVESEAKEDIDAILAKNIPVALSASIAGCPEAAILDSADPFQLTATVLPVGSIQTGTWTSDDELVLTVSTAGLVTVQGAGTATITFTTTDGGHTAECEVVVNEA